MSSQWDSCDDSDLCSSGFVCDDDSYGYCEERFPTVFWVFQFVFIGLFILQCLWAGYDWQKKVAEKPKPAAQPQPQPQPQTQPEVQETVTLSTSNNNQLPSGWEELYTADGKVYYQNNITKQTQWERPIIPNSDQLPPNWVEVYTPDGKVYYQNNTTQTTQWERPVVVQQHIVPTGTPTVAPQNNNNNNIATNNAANSAPCDYGPFLEFPFSTTCRNYVIRLLCCCGAMTSFLFAYLLPSCCPDFYDSNYSDPDCCSWAGTNYFIYIFSWILFCWYCLSGLYLVVVKKETMTWVSSSTTQSGNYQVTTTSVSTSSNMCYNVFMLALQAGILLLAMVILPAIMGDDCQNYYC